MGARVTARLRELLWSGDVVLIKARDTQRSDRIALALAGRRVRCNLDFCRPMPTHCGDCGMLEPGWDGLPRRAGSEGRTSGLIRRRIALRRVRRSRPRSGGPRRSSAPPGGPRSQSLRGELRAKMGENFEEESASEPKAPMPSSRDEWQSEDLNLPDGGFMVGDARLLSRLLVRWRSRRVELAALRQRKPWRLIDHGYRSAPYYQAPMEQAGVEREGIQTNSNLELGQGMHLEDDALIQHESRT